MGVPESLAISTPAWKRKSPEIGWFLMPNCDVISPSAGRKIRWFSVYEFTETFDGISLSEETE